MQAVAQLGLSNLNSPYRTRQQLPVDGNCTSTGTPRSHLSSYYRPTNVQIVTGVICGFGAAETTDVGRWIRCLKPQ